MNSMNNMTIHEKYNEISKLISKKKIKDALDILRELIEQSNKIDFRVQFEKLNDTYQNILKYTFSGVEDPQRKTIYNNLILSILKLSDQIKGSLEDNLKTYVSLQKQNVLKEKLNIVSKTNSLFKKEKFADELDKVLEEISINGNEDSKDTKRQELTNLLFDYLWLSDKYGETEKKLVKKIIKSDNVHWYEKCLIVSGVTLSLLRYFDEQKFDLLFEFYENRQEEVWHRALVGLIICFYIYNSRLQFYPAIIEKIHYLKDILNFEAESEKVIIQLLKSKETEKVTKKFHEEIVPEVLKIQPKIKEKLDLDKLISNEFIEDKNPDWGSFFDDSPGLMDKLQELSEMQLDGADVFMSTFQMLKHFDFFDKIPNWFLPFYDDNEIGKESLQSEETKINKDSFISGLAASSHICNSDKYSFCLNLENLPDAQKSMMLEMLNSEIEGMSEISKEDEIVDKPRKDNSVFTQYIQDYYRFLKLYPQKDEFVDIFTNSFTFHNNTFLKLLDNIGITRTIGEFYFSREYYSEAFDVFKNLLEKGETKQELFEKIAYCYQRLDNYDEALFYYQKAELFDTNRLWNLKKMALCYKHLKETDKALACYIDAEKLKEDDLYIQANIGHCYLEKKDYKKALDYYFKVEFLAPSNISILRPIAWCSFIVGKFDVAKKYYKKLLKSEPNKYDFMNYAHLEWCLGNKQIAFENYIKSIEQKDNDFKSFLSGFKDDEQYLMKHGIDEEEIHLMLDYVKYSVVI